MSALIAACVSRSLRLPVLLVADNSRSQEALLSDAGAWLGLAGLPGPVCFPAWETPPLASRLPSAEVIGERLETLAALSAWREGAGPAPVVVATAAAVSQRTYSPASFAACQRLIRLGDAVNPLELADWLEAQDYEPEARVNHPGEWSMRGGIVDVWPFGRSRPARLEFFGDEIESLREFDPANQASLGAIDSVRLPPATELARLRSEPAAVGSLWDHLPPETPALFWEPELGAVNAQHYAQQAGADCPLLEPPAAWLAAPRARGFPVLALTEFDGPIEGAPEAAERLPPVFESMDLWRPLSDRALEAPVADRQRREFLEQMERWRRTGYRVAVYCHSSGEGQRFAELWTEHDLPAGADGPSVGRAQLAPLSRGFVLAEARLAVVTDAEIFGRGKSRRPRRMRTQAPTRDPSAPWDFNDFAEGDLVVHLNHGIGVYRGLAPAPAGTRKSAAGKPGECLAIEFAPNQPGEEGPRLYVPVTEAHLVSRYIGAGKVRPPLNTLGGGRWAKARDQAARAVRDLAGDLLRLHAERATQPGWPFPEDNEWQREFEASFEFEETPDQMRAIEAVKRDLEAPRPMDRLLCGDVGFGKTEVALRAAFKAVMGGKQVALLAPTTVLAQQHFNLFRERMAGYPVRIELVSRFRTPAERRAALVAAATGGVDIVIGTHGLAQPTVQFRDLGLLIIDEEQRFGVRHKEALRRLRAAVDTLTLSATPIPRTLHLALTGARDLSTLETPPLDRLPVETVVSDHDDRLVRDFINRELNRSGQIYYVHNRVATIDGVAARLRALAPDARVAVAHGQMDDDDLERVMTGFVAGESDVLVSTTIIESGLDIPNANTMIIERADRFGLSELYQLRGRVGRYKHQAYCLLLLPRHARLLTEARRRLSAIKRYSALGSGFKIALRDLELRGAGNVLGAEQSGHITAVGFDLYCRLLQQSIQALRGEAPVTRADTRVSLDFLAMHPGEEERPAAPEPGSGWEGADPDAEDTPAAVVQRAPAYLPANYAPEPSQRLELYRRLAQALTPEALERLRVEARDRFGSEPPAVARLFAVHDLRIRASQRGLTAVEVSGGKVRLMRGQDLVTVGGLLPRLNGRDADRRLAELRRLIASLRG